MERLALLIRNVYGKSSTQATGIAKNTKYSVETYHHA